MLKRATILSLVVCVLSSSALSEPKRNYLMWNYWHWDASLFNPHADPQRVMHDHQWDDSDWHPQDWIEPHGGAKETMESFYENGIITELSVKKGVPQLTAGYAYKDLSPRDRARLAQTIDYIFGVTNEEPYVFRIIDSDSKKVLGIYSKEGFQAH